MDVGGETRNGDNRDEEVTRAREEEEKKPTYMGEEPPQGRGQTPFRRGSTPMAEERSLLEGMRRSNIV
ncbi:unnamed protein product [Trifolium pratense]|uniref:Uncharacterized protein n=1 Tax=Trifolium pratense TaxID=57577 RepID=A0ACB0KHH0_TRIPR|nr:unnamed protein product [Trifolium pratense]